MQIVRIGPGIGTTVRPSTHTQDQTDWSGFGDLLKDSIERVRALEREADLQATRLVAGDVEDLHEVSLASEKARIAMELAIQVRNKAIEAYQEIMRMQV